MGVWIETALGASWLSANLVTPCMGVWIETLTLGLKIKIVMSHTLYGCVD